jgi:hypothetical protein
VYELKDLLATEFSEARVSYAPHICNKVAHEWLDLVVRVRVIWCFYL